MIEVYLFLAMFPVQILGMSVLYPVGLTRQIRTGLKKLPAERLRELYPGVDVGQAHERFLARYRVANTVVVGLGLLLLGWFIIYMQRPNWDGGAVGGMGTAYWLLQLSPIILIAWLTRRFNKVHRRLLPEAKRKAILQRAVGCSTLSRRLPFSLSSWLISSSSHSCSMSHDIRSRGLAVPS